MRKRLSVRFRGFSLIELVIVVAIIGVIGAIAVPRLSRGAEAAGVNSFARTLSAIASELESYQTVNGSYPDQQSGKAMPPEIADLFYAEGGSQFTLFGGGEWEYSYKASDGYAVICAKFDENMDESVLEQVDVILDDGDLSTGLLTKQGSKKLNFMVR